MRRIDNTVRHDPDNNVWGDCHRVCFAMLLDLTPEEVPHFYEEGLGSGPKGLERQDAFVKARGLSLAQIPFQGGNLYAIMKMFENCCPGVPMILSGNSVNGGHSVVVLNGKIFHDPAGSGIEGPADDGYYWITIISIGVAQT